MSEINSTIVNGYAQRAVVPGDSNTVITSAIIISALGYTPYDASNPDGYISSIDSALIVSALGYTPYDASNPSGYISGISGAMVISALGYTPYDVSNPSGYISGISGAMVISALGYTPVTNGRTLTINGTAYDLSADRSWTVSGTTSLNSLVDASGTNTLSNAAFAQTWGWSLTSTTNAFTITDSSNAAGTGYLLSISTTHASSNVKPFRVIHRNTATPLIDTTATGSITITAPAGATITANSTTGITLQATATATPSTTISRTPNDTTAVLTLTSSATTADPRFLLVNKTNLNGGAVGTSITLQGGYSATSADNTYAHVVNISRAIGATPTGDKVLYGYKATVVHTQSAGSNTLMYNYGAYLDVNGTKGENVGIYLNVANAASINNAISIAAGNIKLNTTGVKIGTATTEKLAFWNTTPIVQPTTSVASATPAFNVGTALTDATTFDNYTIGQVVKALRNIGLLA